VSGVHGNAVELYSSQLAVGLSISDAARVVDHVRHVTLSTDHHHDVPGNVDEVADLERADQREPRFVRHVAVECDAFECRTYALVACVTRQLRPEASIDFRDEAAAVARVVGVAPAVALAEKLEALPNHVRRCEWQIVSGDVRRFGNERR